MMTLFNIEQDQVASYFHSAEQLGEDLYIGDIYINDEGQACTTVIKADKSTEVKVMDGELQKTFQQLCATSAGKVSAVMKLNKENVHE